MQILGPLLLILLGIPSYAASAVSDTELQWSVCELSTQSILKKIDLKWSQKKSKDLSYFDTSNLDFFKNGVILRVRAQKSSFKSTAKLRGIRDDQVDWDWMSTRDSKCEWDKFGATQKLSCSVNEEGIYGDPLFTADQKEFILKLYPKTQFTNLQEHGPYLFEEYEAKKALLGLFLTVETVVTTKQSYFEVSVRVSSKVADQTYHDLLVEFNKLGLILCADQKGMTEKILTQ